jgi:hypothetical protein
MKNHKIIIFAIILVALAAGMYFVLNQNQNKPEVTFRTNASVVDSPLPTELPTAAPLPTAEPVIKTDWIDSSDGMKVLTMEQKTLNNKVIYTFFVSTKGDAEKKLIYSEDTNGTKVFSVPFNAWSPNNKMFYIKESTNSGEDNYYVFKTSGELFPGDVQYVSVKDIYSQKFPDSILMNVTGWGPDLLIINTKNSDGQQGTSYWVDVVNKGFTPLSTHYN